MDGSAYGRVLLDAKVLFELGRVVWQSKTSPMDEKGHVPESLKCRPQGSSRVKGKVKTCVMTVLRTLTSTKFKLALRTACATSLTIMLGFIPQTAAFFDEISGLVAVGFVLFDTGSPYQG